jgi:transcriptional regulator with XRE-family HTH domain
MMVHGISVQTLAKKLNISHQSVYNWKLGKTKPRYTLLKQISQVVGIPVDKLIDEFYS